MFTDNIDFYPTPKNLIKKMYSKVGRCKTILEPSAGRGDIVEYILEHHKGFYDRPPKIYTIEKDPNLQKILIGKGYNLIDSDFLTYNGRHHFDLIIANFPFSEGEKHLLRAIDLIYNGELVCLINAETITNPFSEVRKDLIRKLNKLNASIEFIDNAFTTADRKTNVRVALIHIKVENQVEDDLFKGMNPDIEEEIEINQTHSVANKNEIFNLIKNYELDKEKTLNQIVNFYSDYNRISKYLSLSIQGDDSFNNDETLTDIMKSKVNGLLIQIKRHYWNEALKLKEVRKRLTSKKREEIQYYIEAYEKMEFSENNLRIFILNLIEKFPTMIKDAIESLFTELTSYGLQDSRWGTEYKTNTHYYNGWKTNNSYKVNKKVVLPHLCEVDYSGNLRLRYQASSILDDLDIVANYFSIESNEKSSYEICRQALENNITKKINTGLFYISFFKKGTSHIEWKDLNALRWFNIEAGKLKNFLPMDYSNKEYNDLTKEEKDLVDKFETKTQYSKIKTLPILDIKSLNLLE